MTISKVFLRRMEGRSRAGRQAAAAAGSPQSPATPWGKVAMVAIAVLIVGTPASALAQEGGNARHSGTVTITADHPTALLAIDDLVFTVTREVPANNRLQVPVEVSSGIVDPDLLSHTVTIPANQASAKLTISTATRALGARTGEVTATVGDGEFHDVGNPSSASVQVYIGSGLVTLRFNASSLPVSESVGWSTDEVQVIARTRAGVPPPFKNLSLSVITEQSTAQREIDYRGFSRTILVLGESRVRWRADGDSYVSSVQVPVWPIRDDLDEEDETFRLILQRIPQLPWTVRLIPADSSASPCSRSNCRSTVVIVDDDTRGVTIEPTGTLQIDEGGTATYQVVLDSEPTADVTVTPQVQEANYADISVSETLTFNPRNWDRPQRVTVTAGADDNQQDGSATITHAVAGGDYGGRGVIPAPVPVEERDREGDLECTPAKCDEDIVIIEDIEDPGDGENQDTEEAPIPHSGAVTITADRSTALQGVDDLVFTVTREIATATDLEVPVEMSSGILDPDNLSHTATIPADQTSATLTVGTSTLDPVAASGQVTATVGDGESHDVGDPSSASVQVHVGRDLITVRFNSRSYIVDESVGQFDGISLIAQTKAGVPPPFNGFSVSVVAAADTAGSPDDYQALSSTIEIGGASTVAWAASGDFFVLSVPVPLQIVGDDVDEEDERFEVRLQMAPGLPSTVSLIPADSQAPACGAEGCPSAVTITDDNTRGVTVNQTGALRITEGSSAVYTVVLDSAPTENVTVTPQVRDVTNMEVSVSEALTFLPEDWDIPQEVTVTAEVDDNRLDGSATITHTVAGGDYGSAGVTADPVKVTEWDNEMKAVVVTLVRVPDGTVVADNSTVSVGGTIHDGSTFEEGESAWFRILLSAEDGGPAPGGADVELSFQWQHYSPLVPISGEISRVVFSLPRVDVWDSYVDILENDVGNPDSTATIRVTGCKRNRCVIGEPSEITLTITDDDGGPAAAPPGQPARPYTWCLAEGDGYSQTAMTVTWAPPAFEGGAPIDFYEVRYRRLDSVGEPAPEDWQVHPHGTLATTATITGLDTDTSYLVQVRAVNANGPGEWSFSSSFETGLSDQYCGFLDEP